MSQSSRLPRMFHSISLTRQTLRKYLWVWPLVAAVVLGGVGWWVRAAVEGAMKKNMAQDLRTLLKADVEALKVWFHSQEDVVEGIAGDARVRELAAQLVKVGSAGGSTGEDLKHCPAFQQLRVEILPDLKAHDYQGFALIDLEGRLLASDHDEMIGRKTDAPQDLLASLREGKAKVTRPARSLLVIRDDQGKLAAGVPTMFAAAPVRDADNNVIAGLGVRISPSKDFTRILSVARAGTTGETYAFDQDGLLLSQSRFDKDLKQIGLLVDREGERSILNLEIRNPGVDMTTGARPALSRSEQPPTVMVESAVQGNTDVNVDGYRDYRGRPVIGAWTWLDDYGMGIATEVDVAEAYHPLYILRYVFWTLFALLVIGALAIFVFLVVVARLQRSVRRAVLEAKQLGQYHLEEKLGEGGMGTVYKARHAMLRRPTALKLLSVDKTTPDSVARFEREVQLTSQLNHPNTIQIYDYGRTDEGIFYYAMEYLDGINLDELVHKFGPQPPGRIVHVLQQVLGSLAEAHAAGVIHRDIKPANILLNRRGGVDDVVKVLDFGLVKALDDRHGVSQTSSGAVVGTPQYLSPEGIDLPNEVSPRSDLYAVGLVGYYLLTGTHAFRGSSVLEVCMQQLHESPQPPSERLSEQVDGDLEALLLRCLAKTPGDRPGSARELIKALSGCRAAGSWTAEDAEAWWDRYLANARDSQYAPTRPIPPGAVLGTGETLVHPRHQSE